jgi:hypothetical protein
VWKSNYDTHILSPMVSRCYVSPFFSIAVNGVQFRQSATRNLSAPWRYAFPLGLSLRKAFA